METRTPKRYAKKWWLETALPNGKVFKGWITTMAENVADFPDMLYGTFCAWKDEEGLHGHFLLDGQSEAAVKENRQYVVMSGIFNEPIPQQVDRPPMSRYEADMILESIRPVNCLFERFDRRLENCIVLSKTYIETY